MSDEPEGGRRTEVCLWAGRIADPPTEGVDLHAPPAGDLPVETHLSWLTAGPDSAGDLENEQYEDDQAFARGWRSLTSGVTSGVQT